MDRRISIVFSTATSDHWTASMSANQARLEAILDREDAAQEYEQWHARQARAARDARADYLFSEPVARFRPAASDLLVGLEDIEAAGDAAACRLTAPDEPATLTVDVPVRVARRIIDAVEGEHTLGELRQSRRFTSEELDRFLGATFGVLVFAPGAVRALENRLSGVEITRYPGSPYEIVRSYWQNMLDVRDEAPSLDPSRQSTPEATHALRKLHVLALMGANLDTFYLPSSRIAARKVSPGALLTQPSQTEPGPQETRFVSGPRVNASLIGGELYHRALFEFLSDPEASLPERTICAEDGLGWGRVVTARADADAEAAPWFCPPRPIEEEHWKRLFDAYGSAITAVRGQDRPGAVTALARFHQRFIRLHPFRCANQSLAMNLVNHLLVQSHGAGMPHLILDHLALRLSESAYERLFAVAVGAWVLPSGDPTRRYGALVDRKQSAYRFIPRVAGCDSLEQAIDLVQASREEARLALFPV
jgi:hypothetical protein